MSGLPSPVAPGTPPPLLTAREARWLDALRPWVSTLVRRCGLAAADVEEVLQEVFLLACAKWASFQPPARVSAQVARRGWVAGILWRVMGKHLARLRRERGHVPLDEEGVGAAGATESPEGRMGVREELCLLERATTPERWRVVVAHWHHGVSIAEIARREGRPVPTIYNLLRLARLDFAAARRRESAASRAPAVPCRRR